MKVDGWLERVQFENIAASATTPAATGRVYCDTTSPTAAVIRFYDGTAWRQLLSSASSGIVTKTGAYTVAITDGTVYVSGDNYSITLPAASSTPGQIVRILKTDGLGANGITVQRTGSDTIRDGSSTTVKLQTLDECWSFQSDGISCWRVLSHFCETAWTTFTVAITATGTACVEGTNTKTARWRRSRSGVELQYEYVQTVGGTAGSGTYKYNIPTNMVIDSTQVTVDTSDNTGLSGSAYASATTTPGVAGWCKPYDTTHLILITMAAAGTSANHVGAGSDFPLSSTNLKYGFRAIIPLVGWDP